MSNRAVRHETETIYRGEADNPPISMSYSITRTRQNTETADMNANNFRLNQMYIDELKHALAMERLAQQVSGEESALAAYLNAHLLAPLGRKMIRSGQLLLDMSEGATKTEQIAYRAS